MFHEIPKVIDFQATHLKATGDFILQELFRDFLEEAPYIINQAISAFQALMGRNFQATRAQVPEEYMPQTAADKTPVSYTHLDVYKRQDQSSKLSLKWYERHLIPFSVSFQI